jgi:hypothetical protein
MTGIVIAFDRIGDELRQGKAIEIEARLAVLERAAGNQPR